MSSFSKHLLLGVFFLPAAIAGHHNPLDLNTSASNKIFSRASLGDDLRTIRSHLAHNRNQTARELALKGFRRTGAGIYLWLSAKAAQRLNLSAEAIADYQRLINLKSELEPWARLLLAERLLESDPQRAQTHAEALKTQSWPAAERAQNVYLRALVKRGQASKARDDLKGRVGQTYDRANLDLMVALAEALEQSGAPDDKAEAFKIWRWIAARKPNTGLAANAQYRSGTLWTTLSKEQQTLINAQSDQFEFERGQALLKSGDGLNAMVVLEQLANKLGTKSDLGCKARFAQAKALLSRKERPRGVALMREVAQNCSDSALRTRALFNAAQGLNNLNQPDEALELYRKVEQTAKTDSLADDALYKSALVARDLAKVDEQRAALERVTKDYAAGDMAPMALFQLAWLARSEQKWPVALHWLELLKQSGRKESEDTLGQAEYWKARTLAQMGRLSEGEALYKEVMQQYPLTYYAQQAYARLVESNPNVAAAQLKSWQSRRPRPSIEAHLKDYPKEPWIKRAWSLAQAGEMHYVAEEFRYAKFLETGDTQLQANLYARLLYAFELYPLLIEHSRRKRDWIFQAELNPTQRELWFMAYPKAYGDLIGRLAKQATVNESWVYATAREESSFEPNAASPANAYGLIQLIVPTAKTYARELNLTVTPQTLQEPETNVRIGLRFMRELWQRYESNPAVIPAAYNAGLTATQRWLAQRSSEPLDIWIENIPYEETRRYTRRVLQTYGIYTFIESGLLPPLRSKLAPP